METLTFEIEIAAPSHIVWATMLEPDSYRQWTEDFNPGSYYTGDWELGSTIRFLGPNPHDDGAEGGMLGTIVAHRPQEFVSVEYRGMVADGEDDITSDAAKLIAGTHESYSFSEADGVTTLAVEIEVADEWAEMFREEWPVALDRLRSLAEQADAASRERLGSE